jgi:hypothetical protein
LEQAGHRVRAVVVVGVECVCLCLRDLSLYCQMALFDALFGCFQCLHFGCCHVPFLGIGLDVDFFPFESLLFDPAAVVRELLVIHVLFVAAVVHEEGHVLVFLDSVGEIGFLIVVAVVVVLPIVLYRGMGILSSRSLDVGALVQLVLERTASKA